MFDKLSILRALFPTPQIASEIATRWQAAGSKEPKLVADIISIGAILSSPVREYIDGVEVPNPICPIRMARDQGRRDMATELLALMQITPEELRNLTENSNEYT
ncbi:MAG: hypothetical protein JKY93_03610 [Gammaproteobacteria bacterium]|nr:hypothetical protein [Gammaproteobacteria bacterium]